MKSRRDEFGVVVDWRTMGRIVRWRPEVFNVIRTAASPGKGRRVSPKPFSLVMRLGVGRGTFFKVAGSFAKLGNASRKQETLPRGVVSWICLAPGYALTPTRTARF